MEVGKIVFHCFSYILIASYSTETLNATLSSVKVATDMNETTDLPQQEINNHFDKYLFSIY